MTSIFEDVIQHGTGYPNAIIGRPAAGKTGTTSDFRDAWFVGYTPDLVAAVWIGNDDYTPMNESYGGNIPARIWARFMKARARRDAAARVPVPGRRSRQGQRVRQWRRVLPEGNGVVVPRLCAELRRRRQCRDQRVCGTADADADNAARQCDAPGRVTHARAAADRVAGTLGLDVANARPLSARESTTSSKSPSENFRDDLQPGWRAIASCSALRSSARSPTSSAGPTATSTLP